ncbi:response regulator [Psychroserpens burtonensis]|uniref:histidine kinase n=1 Tax=Psychroserpens burtonensis TaxID=49278 RepID=A0A5C7BCC0_9FLAO|nr:response regulator [Psychroserpens burtonensis]TXE19337.1 response regulator [Psychroserpens burtonensis]
MPLNLQKHPAFFLFLTLFCNLNTFSQTENKLAETSCTFDNQNLDRLISNDSLYEATILLSEALLFAKNNNFKAAEAKTYYNLGKVLAEMGNYKNAEDYYYRALAIFDSLQLSKEKDLTLTGLTTTYADGKYFNKFDSIYPITQQHSKQLNSELQFVNLVNKIKKHYYSLENDSLLSTTKYAISKLDVTDFNTLKHSKQYKTTVSKKNFKIYFEYHNAVAKIKSNNYKKNGFDQLLNISEDELKDALSREKDKYRKLATFNYYKFLYYKNNIKDLDSANSYLLKSDTYKYDALRDYEERSIKNSELIYKIITTEQQLELTEKTRKNEAQLSRTYLISTIIVSFILFLSLIIFLFYYKAKKNINLINKELQVTNDKLVATDKERLEFFSILSHELRTPIYGINGLATLIKQEDDLEKRQKYLNSLISSSNYISLLIDNVLQATKLRFEDKNLRLKPDKMNNLIKNVTSTVEIAAKNKGLNFYIDIEESKDDEYILIDKVAFSQILINLAYNGIRYTKEGSVSISVKEKDRTANHVTLLFEVKDTGIGIAKENRSLVFNAFENKTFLDQNSRGSGLGLYIVKTLLKSHNTDIDFISEKGKGSTFFFEATFEISRNNKEDLSTINSLHNTEAHILVVDDNKINLLITKKNIEKIKGHTCETTSNGRQSISIVKDKNFDLILMDINMPDMDGFEVTKHIRMFNPDIPILALTALNSNEIEEKAQKSGINQVITKPYNFEDFRNIIQSYSNLAHHQ